MQLQTARFLLVSGIFAVSSPAFADSTVKDTIDITAIRDEITFLHDGKGHYVAVRAKPKGDRKLFYGDGTTFYEQRTMGKSVDLSKPNPQYSWTYWSPRTVKGKAYLDLRDKTWVIGCDKRKTTMTELPAAETKKLLTKAMFRKQLWKRKAHTLARDDRGTYYYVDRLYDYDQGKDFRVFTGKPGNLKKRKMTNIVNDSRGAIFETRSGKLRLLLDQGQAQWIRRGKKRTLRMVPVKRNLRMIYTDLGVYEGPIGTPCDHL